MKVTPHAFLSLVLGLLSACVMDWSRADLGNGPDPSLCLTTPHADGCPGVDECALTPRRCHPSATCVDLEVGFQCECPENTLAMGEACVRAAADDPCASQHGGCAVEADCEVREAAAVCTCREGFVGDGRTCRPRVLAMDAYQWHSCAILADGSLWCWGDNRAGQLGIALAVPQATVPMRVGDHNDWQQVAVGIEHVCGLRAGKLFCWGSNRRGELGVGPGPDEREPMQVGQDADWTAVSAGDARTCALKGKRLFCWGGADEYPKELAGEWTKLVRGAELGLRQGELWTTEDPPARVGDASDWTDVSSQGNRYCGLRSGALWCWGYNQQSALGLGEGLSDYIVEPSRVGSSTDWQHIFVGSHTCGIRSGELWCWGSNDRGQLGLGAAAAGPVVSSPARVGSDVGYEAVAAGAAHACAIRLGDLYCWGNSEGGALGQSEFSAPFTLKPAALPRAVPWNIVDAGVSDACGIAEGALWCWGKGHAFVPVQIGASIGWRSIASSGSAFHSYRCGIRAGGLYCWGQAGPELGLGDQLNGVDHAEPMVVGDQTDWVSVATGGAACGIRGDDSLWCWGTNLAGRLGLPELVSGATRGEPANVVPGSTWRQVSAGERHVCAIRKDGTMWCWGANDYGALGLGETQLDIDQFAPQLVGAANDWIDLAAGGGHTCAIRSDKSLWCWGKNGYGQLGLGEEAYNQNQYEPRRVGEEVGWSQVAVGTAHSCGIRGRALFCWGLNDKGQVGTGVLNSRHGTALPTKILDDVASVTADKDGTCAVDDSGASSCWGDNRFGQTGVFSGAPEPSGPLLFVPVAEGR